MRANPLAVFVLFCSIISAAFAWYAWQKRTTHKSQLFSVFMVSMAIYTFGYSMELASVTLPAMLFWSKIGYFGIFAFPTLFLLFVAQFTGRDNWLRWRYILLLFVIPSLLLIAKLTDDRFHLVYSHVWVDNNGAIPLLGYTPGPIYPFALYACIPVGLGMLFLWQKRRISSGVFRKQLSLMLAGTMLPLLVFIFYMSGYHPFPELEFLDLNVFMYVIWGVGLGWAFFHFHLFALVPVARDMIFERLDDGVMVLDDQMRLVDVNHAAMNVMAWAKPPIGQTASQIFPNWENLQNMFEPGETVIPVKTEFQHAAREIPTYFELSSTALLDKSDKGIGWLVVIRDITERKLAEETQLKLAAMEERQRLARDLHDSVNQSIHGMVLFSETLIATLDKDNIDRAKQIAERMQESARQALKETRRLLYQIQADDALKEIDFIQDLEMRLLTVERRAGVKATIHQEGTVDDFPPEWQKNLFWITIEALNNALKHAQAHSVQIIVRNTANETEGDTPHLYLEIKDDGKGFDPEEPRSGGFGLKSMQERADLLGGKLAIISSPGRGTSVCVTVTRKGLKGY